MRHIWPCMKSKKFFQLQWKIKIIQFLVFEFFCMILVWFLGNHIWSLYDYQEFIQIIYDLVWLLRIIYDLVRNQRKLDDRWPGYWRSIIVIFELFVFKGATKGVKKSNLFCYKFFMPLHTNYELLPSTILWTKLERARIDPTFFLLRETIQHFFRLFKKALSKLV